MHAPHTRYALVLSAVICACALVAGAARASEGGDFAAFFRYDKTADLTGKKKITLSLRLFNYSEGAVHGAAVVLQGAPDGARLGRVGHVAIAAGHSAPVTGKFVIPEAEYQRWEDGEMPSVAIEYADVAGNRVTRPIELIPEIAAGP